MGIFGIGGSKGKDDETNTVQRSMDSVAVAKKRMMKSKSQRDAEEAQWAADEAEIKQLDAKEKKPEEQKEKQVQAPEHVATYNPSPAKPAVKSAMKQKSKFDSERQVRMSTSWTLPRSLCCRACYRRANALRLGLGGASSCRIGL
jgi:hypothetical protein